MGMTNPERRVPHVPPRETVGQRVKLMREESGLSQRAAALRCGLTFGEWQGLEGGADVRGLDRKVDKIAEHLKYDRDWIMWGGPLQGEADQGGGGVNASSDEDLTGFTPADESPLQAA